MSTSVAPGPPPGGAAAFAADAQYARLLARTRARADGYDDYEADDNVRIRAFLHARLDQIEALGAASERDALRADIRRVLDETASLGLSPSSQAIVFFFKRGSYEFYMWGFRSLPRTRLDDPGDELPHPDRGNPVFEERGPVRYPAGYDLTLEAYDEEEEFDLGDELDALSELRVLQTFRVFRDAFVDAFDPAWVTAARLASPCLCYVQETGGGRCGFLLRHDGTGDQRRS